MASAVKEKVFEKKNTKIKAVLYYTVRYGISLAVIYGALILYAYNAHVPNPIPFASKYWLIFFGVAALGIIMKAVQTNDVNVTVMSKSVDITAGGTNYVYQLEQFVGPFIDTKKRGKESYELVFADVADNPDTTHFIPLPGIKVREFIEISDAITVAKEELSGEHNYEAFEGDLYEKTRKDGVDAKAAILGFLVIAIPVWLTIFLLLEKFIFNHEIIEFSLHITVAIVAFAIVLGKFAGHMIERGPQPKKLKTLKFSNSGYEINGTFYSYKDIEYVSMTEPYLTGFSAYFRVLALTLFDSKKPLKFSIGNRIEKDESEEELGKGCTCPYPALYERIKTDKSLGRKFQL